jgi:hypothetical protein
VTVTAPVEPRPQTGWFTRGWNQHEAIKNHLTSIAIVGAGLWTGFLFASLHTVKRAEADLAALRQEPVANIDLAVDNLKLPGQSARGLIVTASVENTGRRTAVLVFGSTPPLTVVRLRTDSLGALFPEASRAFTVLAIAPGKNSVLALPKASLLPGERTKYQFLVPKVGSGIYLIQFSVPVAQKDAPTPGWHWVARRFHVVSVPSPRVTRRLRPSCARETQRAVIPP